MDTQKVDLVLQYILALAAEEDDFRERSLGQIHLIKYVYLADLAYHEHLGVTFTGINWQFHKFGPWSTDLYNRIDDALAGIGAEKTALPSAFNEDDYYRWSIRTSESSGLVERLDRQVPIYVSSILRRSVHQFTNDTSSLLQRVYTTTPMLQAAPGETLIFPVKNQAAHTSESSSSCNPNPEQPSKTALKKRQAKMDLLHENIQAKIADKLRKMTSPRKYTEPRHDTIFSSGQEWLDSLAGEEIREEEGELEFSAEIWKSRERYDPDVS